MLQIPDMTRVIHSSFSLLVQIPAKSPAGSQVLRWIIYFQKCQETVKAIPAVMQSGASVGSVKHPPDDGSFSLTTCLDSSFRKLIVSSVDRVFLPVHCWWMDISLTIIYQC